MEEYQMTKEDEKYILFDDSEFDDWPPGETMSDEELEEFEKTIPPEKMRELEKNLKEIELELDKKYKHNIK